MKRLIVAISLGKPSDARFASGKSALNIPFKLLNNHIYLQISVNDAELLWFLLDKIDVDAEGQITTRTVIRVKWEHPLDGSWGRNFSGSSL